MVVRGVAIGLKKVDRAVPLGSSWCCGEDINKGQSNVEENVRGI